jgi:large subunit ribosomal protein L32
MALPGHRRTSSDKRRRAAHFALKKINFFHCPKCKKPVLPHHACANCGTYAGRQVLKIKTKKKKKE